MAWGWRIPFLLNLIVLAVGVFIRRRIPETPEFTAVKQSSRQAGESASSLRAPGSPSMSNPLVNDRPPARGNASDARFGTAIRIAARSIKLDTKMSAKRPDRFFMFRVRIAIGNANYDRSKSITFPPARRKHGGY
jgi:MFS family permease